MTKPLTAKQARLLTAIKDYMAKHGFAPTLDELCDAVGYKSKSSAFYRLEELTKSGWIQRGFGARNIRLTTAAGKCPCCGK